MKNFDFNFYKGKKVLVTGHTGFKGAWLCRILLGLGAEVTGYALEPPTDPELFGLLDLEKNMNSVKGDIRCPEGDTAGDRASSCGTADRS